MHQGEPHGSNVGERDCGEGLIFWVAKLDRSIYLWAFPGSTTPAASTLQLDAGGSWESKLPLSGGCVDTEMKAGVNSPYHSVYSHSTVLELNTAGLPLGNQQCAAQLFL